MKRDTTWTPAVNWLACIFGLALGGAFFYAGMEKRLEPAQFAEAMLAHDVQSYEAASRQDGVVFFDRGIPDVIGYLNLMKLPVPGQMAEAARRYRYNPRVFIAPFWPEIFMQDDERKQTPEEAERTYQAMVRIYGDYGYDLVTLPRVPVAERVAFVRRTIAA